MKIVPNRPDEPSGTHPTARVTKPPTKALRAVESVPTLAPLTESEVAELAGHERVIGAGLRTFVQVGEALARVRDGKLYRGTHRTFSDYCADRWGISDRQGRRLIAAHTVAELTGPAGPVSERVTRELAPLRDDPALLTEVWQDAQRLAGGGIPTADHVIAAREDAVVRTVATRRPKVIAKVVSEAPEALAAVAASKAVRKAIDEGDTMVRKGIRKRAKEKRELPEALGIARLELLVLADDVHVNASKIVNLMRAGAMEGVPDEVREEVTATTRKTADMLAWAVELCENGVRATDEALDKWLDQSGDQQ